MSRPQPLAVIREGFRITWRGGPHAEVTLPDVGNIACLHMTLPDGTVPPQSRTALRAAVDAADPARWHRAYARHLRRTARPVGAR